MTPNYIASLHCLLLQRVIMINLTTKKVSSGKSLREAQMNDNHILMI